MSQQQGDDVHVCMDSRQAAVLARSVAHAARVAGAELALRANTSGLLIHGVSKAKTACLDVRFSPRFFEYFHVTGEDADATTGNDDNVDFAVYTKSLLAVLKKPRLGVVEMRFARDHPERVFCSIKCKNGLQMKYSLDCLDGVQVLESGARAERMNAQVSLDAGEMCRLLSAFQPRLSDMRIVAYPDGWHDRHGSNRKQCAIKLESCIEHHENIELYTELLVPREALHDFTVRERQPIDVSSSLKDIKGMASFCNNLEVDVVMSFNKAGTPLVMTSRFRQGIDEEEVGWSAKLVLATLMHSGGGMANQHQQQEQEQQPYGAHMRQNGAEDEHASPPASAMARSNVLPGDTSHTYTDGRDDATDIASPGMAPWRSDGGNSQAAAGPRVDAHMDKRQRINPQVLVSDSQPTATTATTSRGVRTGAVDALNHLKYDNFQQQMRRVSDENEHDENTYYYRTNNAEMDGMHHEEEFDDDDDDDDDDDEEFIDATPPHRQTGSLFLSPEYQHQHPS